MEALADTQTVGNREDFTFDIDSIDSVDGSITLDPSGRTFTIYRTGLYQIEWSLNLASFDPSVTTVVVGIIEDGAGASGAACSASGNFSSGTLIYVDSVPFTISLRNYESEITIESPFRWENSAGSIRIIRFADGPN